MWANWENIWEIWNLQQPDDNVTTQYRNNATHIIILHKVHIFANQQNEEWSKRELQLRVFKNCNLRSL